VATKLEGVRINEVSGVDRPANLVDGWILMKNRKPSLLRKAGDPVRLSDGRVVGRVVGFGDGRVTVDWATDEIRDLAKQGRLEQHEHGIYLVGGDGQIGFGKALLTGQPVVLS
jgi:hypothetical protein